MNINSHLLCFDPIYRKHVPPFLPIPNPIKGREALSYFQSDPGIKLMPNGDIFFSIFLPEAKKVALHIDGIEEPIFLTKCKDNYFRGECHAISDGFHYIQFTADNIPYLHPTLPIGYGYGHAANYIDFPNVNSMPALKNVSHGRLAQEIYYSHLARRERICWIYTPPGYECTFDKHFPVLYIQHGSGESETSWFWQGKLHYILDNMMRHIFVKK